MIKTIRLENFMAHQATSIDLSPGVTVITGPNNIGKSAIVEAIRSLVYNPSPKNVIRHGAKKALVHLELDSGEIITWQRQDKNASYTIRQPGQEPAEYYKFGRDVPQDVRSLLRLDLVETDTEAIDIHLGNQRHPIFLLDRPGSHAAGFFAASTEADYLLKMQQLLKGKIEQGKRDKKRLDAELIALQQQLDRYLPLDDLEAKIIAAEALDNVILAIARQLPLMTEIIIRLLETQGHLHRQAQAATALGFLEGPPALKDITGLTLLLSELTDKTSQSRRETARNAVLADLTPPPVLDPTAELESFLVQVRATQALHTAAQTQSRLLAPLTPPPATAEVEKMQELVRIYKETLAKSAAWQQHRTILTATAEPPHLEDTAALEGLIVQLSREQARQESQGRATVLLAGLHPPPETAVLSALENSLAALRQADDDVSRQQAYLTSLAVQLDRKKTEIQTYLQETGICPLCGSPLDVEHFLENRHA